MNYFNYLFFSEFQLAFWILLAIFILYIFIQLPNWKKIAYKVKHFSDPKQRSEENIRRLSSEVTKALETLIALNKGASFIIQKYDDIDPFINNETKLDAIVSAELIINIFEGNKSPLHDGALVVKNNRIWLASAYINFLSSSTELPPRFGTRHRSAIGITEKTDAVAVILSEESGDITLAKDGSFKKVSINDFEREFSKAIKKSR